LNIPSVYFHFVLTTGPKLLSLLLKWRSVLLRRIFKARLWKKSRLLLLHGSCHLFSQFILKVKQSAFDRGGGQGWPGVTSNQRVSKVLVCSCFMFLCLMVVLVYSVVF
jgi:hypothetical protein